MQTFRKRRAGLSATAGLSCIILREMQFSFQCNFCLFVCLSVYLSAIRFSESSGRLLTKFCGRGRDSPRIKWRSRDHDPHQALEHDPHSNPDHDPDRDLKCIRKRKIDLTLVAMWIMSTSMSNVNLYSAFT